MGYPPGVMRANPPFTSGHENAGWISQLGPGVQGFKEGDAVVVYASWGCGFCSFCRRGWESYCECTDPAIRPGSGGLGSDGGMAEYLLVPSARLLIRLHKLDPRDAAPLTDATATSYQAVKRSLGLLVPGTTAVIIGVGGLGQFGVQLLRVLSAATIVAVDTSAEKLAIAQQLGADHCIVAGADSSSQIRDLTHGVGAEAVFDFVGADSTLALAAQVGADPGARDVDWPGPWDLPLRLPQCAARLHL
jgi:propanol-preferring alcohol dehydrogenase